MTNVLSAYFAYKFIRIVATPWEKSPAFKAGVLSAKGRLLVPRSEMTREQRGTYGAFERLAYNVKRVVSSAPSGGSRLASYSAALFLLRDDVDREDGDVERVDEDEPTTTSGAVERTEAPIAPVARRKKTK